MNKISACRPFFVPKSRIFLLHGLSAISNCSMLLKPYRTSKRNTNNKKSCRLEKQAMSRQTKVIELDTKRKALEEESKAITDELTQTSLDDNGNHIAPMGIDTPLIDEEGFPRGDIDIYRARDLRKRLNEIRYDHRIIMKEIESRLINGSPSVNEGSSSASGIGRGNSMAEDESIARRATKPKPKFDKVTGKWVVQNWDGTVAGVEDGHLRSFEQLNDEKNTNGTSHSQRVQTIDNQGKTEESDKHAHSTVGTIASSSEIDELLTAFAKVNEIFDASPAAKAGLHLYDKIVRIGNIDCTNHRDLRAVADIVQNAFLDGKSIDCLIEREAALSHTLSRMKLTVKPGYWEGDGILGCRIVKI